MPHIAGKKADCFAADNLQNAAWAGNLTERFHLLEERILENSNPENSRINAETVIARTAAAGIWGNVFLAALKLAAGIFGHSTAIISDAVHTLSDVFATLIAWIGVRMGRKTPDREHPYGHDRFECIASLILAAVLVVTGISIGMNCIGQIRSGAYRTAPVPGGIAVIAAIVSILVKEGMYWYTSINAKKIRSGAFQADAWHHRSDALTSVGALIGIVGARRGVPVLDPVAGIVICLVILYVAYGISRSAFGKMVDKACSPEFEQKVRDMIRDYSEENGKEIGIDLFRSRLFGDNVYLEIELSLDGSMSLSDAHKVAQDLHDRIENSLENVKHVMIHLNPRGEE